MGAERQCLTWEAIGKIQKLTRQLNSPRTSKAQAKKIIATLKRMTKNKRTTCHW